MRRLPFIFVLAFVAGCSGKVDQQKFDPLYRAGKAIESATSLGVNILKYRELVQDLATEVSIGNDRASSGREKKMVALFGEALAAYKDAETVWGTKLKATRSQLTVSEYPELGRIVSDYPINGLGVGPSFEFWPDPAIQVIWQRAGAKVRAAIAEYTGIPVPDLPEPK